MKHRHYILPILIVFALCLFSCRQSGTVNSSAVYEYTDDYGNTVNVPKSPQRVVSLSPAVTEIMYALDNSAILIGRTDFCQYPPEAQSIESVGGISNLNVEKILSLKPDLVISGSMIPQKSAQQLTKLGVPVVCVIEKPQFEGLYDNIKKIGSLVCRESVADSLVAELKKEMSAIPESKGDKPSVYYVVGYGPNGNFTAGGNTFINDIIRVAGGHNIAEGVQGWSYSLEALMDNNPDFIIIRREDSAGFCKTKPYTNLDAVKNGKVIAIESSIIDLQIPRNIECIRLLSKAFCNRN